MSDITIVTAFFDIGRGDWSPDKGLPHYLQRTNDTYFERFSHLASLDNNMVIYTSQDLAERISQYRIGKMDKTKIVCFDFANAFDKERKIIQTVQSNIEYRANINPIQSKNPEYWSVDYVLVNYLKSSFVNHAINNGLVPDELVAWLDFGYCRSKDILFGVTKWQYPFNKNLIHVFSIKNFKEGRMIQDIIFNNDVHITGPHIIASKSMWPKLDIMINHHFLFLANSNLMDDDQTLLLMSTLSNPEVFEVHKVSPNDWFVIFRDYNENIS